MDMKDSTRVLCCVSLIEEESELLESLKLYCYNVTILVSVTAAKAERSIEMV